MIRFQADADLHQSLVGAVRRREPAVDFASAAEGGVIRLADSDVLEVAARQERILVTHDHRTMPQYFRERLISGKSSPGVFLVSQSAPIGPVVEALILVWSASEAAEWQNHICHLPSLLPHAYGRD